MSSLLQPRLLLRFSLFRIPLQSYLFSSTSHARARGKAVSADVEIDRYGEPLVSEEDESSSATYESWISSSGLRFMHPNPLGPKWLGDSVPFPLNPTFKPPTPLSDAMRTAIYKTYINNPALNHLHALSLRFGVSVKRIEAIIKLKSLEVQWIQNKTLQSGFLAGMESVLGIPQGNNKLFIPDEMSWPEREDARQADAMSEYGEQRKRGLGRTFYEPVDEGEEPIVPQLLQSEQEARAKVITQEKTYPSHVVQPDPSRPAFKFIDVGLRWFNAHKASVRRKESERRKGIKTRKVQKVGKNTVVYT